MLLLLSVILGAVIGLLMKGSLFRLGGLKGLWFPIAAMAVTPVLGMMPGIGLAAKAALISISYGCIVAFSLSNRKYPLPALLIAVGSLANYTVIAANSFRMPVSQKALEVYGSISAQAVLESRADYFIADAGARLLFLGDVIYIPIPVVGGFISCGDIVLSLGMMLLMVMVMKGKATEE